MKLYIYKDGFCDPENNIGHVRQFEVAEDLDDFLMLLVGSMKLGSIGKFRAFTTNDDVEFQEVDHFVLFNEPLNIKLKDSIREINLFPIAKEANEVFKRLDKRRQEFLEERAKKLKAP